MYEDAKVQTGGVPQRHLFTYLPAGYDPEVIVQNGTVPPPGAHKTTYSFATDAFGIFKKEPTGNKFIGSLIPPILQLWPGDVLHARLISCEAFSPQYALDEVPIPQNGVVTRASGNDDCPSSPLKTNYFLTNLHTHGLIVSPQNSLGTRTSRPQNGTGDNVFAAVPFNDKFDYTIKIPKEHPSGLYWYHPHIHGVSARQVTGGMAGLIAIGEPTDIMHDGLSTLSDAQFQAAHRAESDIRFVILKDTQLVTTDLPESIDGSIKGMRLQPADPLLCADSSFPRATGKRDQQGICWINNNTYSSPNPNYDSGNLGSVSPVSGYPVWLFTVNGERYPTFEAQPGKKYFIFRISNQSASVTYDLQVVDRTMSPDGKPVPLTLLTIDGVVAGAPGGLSATQPAPETAVTHLLLMPAARAEIRMEVPAPGNEYELVANNHKLMDVHGKDVYGLVTGIGPYGTDSSVSPSDPYKTQNTGDSWPYVALARLTSRAASTSPPRPIRLRDPALSQSHAFTALQTFVDPAPPRGCVDPSLHLAKSGPAPARRIIVLNNPMQAPFELGYSRGDATQEKSLIDPAPFPHPVFWRDVTISQHQYKATPHICVAFGDEEIWEIRNLTGELHNFHIHQSKFQLATKDEIALVTQNDILTGTANPVECVVTPGAPCWSDPNHFMDADTYGNLAILNGVPVLHDTFPVPPGANLDSMGIAATPGRVFLKITFRKAEQIGRYVYHCHILEHEDGGMMAPIEVVDPRTLPTSSSSRPSNTTWSGRFASLFAFSARPQFNDDAALDAALRDSLCTSTAPGSIN